MNIFILDKDPIKAAEIQINSAGRYSFKLILESAQMLSTAVRYHGYSGDDVYKSAYLNHPCTVWARENKANFKWLVDMSLAMCNLYTLNTGKVYASEKIIRNCLDLIDLLPEGELTLPALAVNSTEFGIQAKLNHSSILDTWEGIVKVYQEFYFNKHYIKVCALS